MSRAPEIEANGIAAHLSRLLQGVGKLVADHLALARLEIGEDARAIGARLVVIALFVPLVVIGYALLCVALAVFVGRWLTPAGALLAVGGANLVAGVIGLKIASARLAAAGSTTLTAMDRHVQSVEAAGR